VSVYAGRYVTRSAFAERVKFPPLFAPTCDRYGDGDRECEAWDIDTSFLPPVTRLYHLPPIGLGTPMVESMTGYIVRLAQEHWCISGCPLLERDQDVGGQRQHFYLPRYQRRRLLHPHHQRLGLPSSRFCACLGDPHWASRSVLPDASHLAPGSTRPFVASPLPGVVRELYVRLARSKPTYLRAPSLDPAGRNRLPVPSPDLAPNVPAL